MKESTIHVKLITRERILVDGDFEFAVIPAGGGPIGVLPGHAPLMGTVTAGVLRLRDEEKKESTVFVDNGFFMIDRQGIIVTVPVAELSAVIDVDRAQAARDRARRRLNSRDASIDMYRARVALNRAEARLKAALVTA